MLAPMTWHRVPIKNNKDSEIILEPSIQTCLIIRSPPIILPVYGAPTFHNTLDSEKFILLCNMSTKSIDIPAGVIIAQQELAQSLNEEKSFEVLSEDMALATPRSGTESKCKDRHPQVDKLKYSNDQTVEKNFDLSSIKSL